MSARRRSTRRSVPRQGRSLPAPARAKGKRDRQLAEHTERLARIRTWRTIALYLGLLPLAGLTACDLGLSIACVPREIYLGIWAAVVGAVAGLSIRLVLERRRFQQRTPPG